MNKTYVIFLLILCSFTHQKLAAQDEVRFKKIEEYILEDKLDSAQIYLQNFNFENLSYVVVLDKITKKKPVNSSEYLYFYQRLASRTDLTGQEVLEHFKDNIEEPTEGEIDYNYVRTYHALIYRLDNDEELNIANPEHQLLTKYVNRFNDSERDVKRAKLLLNARDVLMKLITFERNNSIALAEQRLEEAIALQDTNLITLYLFYASEFCIIDANIDLFFEYNSKALNIEKNRAIKSPSYYDNVFNKIDALSYIGGQDETVYNLLIEVYKNPQQRPSSYSYFANYIGTIDTNSINTQKVFQLFDVNNVLDFGDSLINLGRGLNLNELFYIQRSVAIAYKNYGYHDKAFFMMDEAVGTNRKVYGTELSNSLAKSQSDKVKLEKEFEIKAEKSKNKYYLIIAIAASLFFIISILAFFRKRKRAKILASKNIEIEKQKVELETSNGEKQLLLKEIHHRVKNNFQIVTSLLELQTRGIEDSKAKDLALEAQSRVKSMALIHQKLYQNENLRIKLKEYITQLTQEVNNMYSSRAIITTFDIDQELELDIDTAIPLGLILNELITNSFKYAFNDSRENTLNIKIETSEDYHVMTIIDNGPGIPSDINVLKTKSLGLRLVRRLTKQLHGKFDIKKGMGATFIIHFKTTDKRKDSE